MAEAAVAREPAELNRILAKKEREKKKRRQKMKENDTVNERSLNMT